MAVARAAFCHVSWGRLVFQLHDLTIGLRELKHCAVAPRSASQNGNRDAYLPSISMRGCYR
jgi:hypothetical protein